MNDFIVNRPALESKVLELIKDKEDSNPCCYEISRMLSSEMPLHGFSKPHVKDGIAAYQLEFLLHNLDPMKKKLENFLRRQMTVFSYLEIAHSWCEISDEKENFRIDYLPITSKSPSESMLLLTYAEKEDDRAQYFPIGREINFLNRKFIYTPLTGPKIGPICLPRIKFFHKIQTEIS